MRYRDNWISTFSRLCGSYEEATSIKPMRYTDEPPPPFAGVGYANAVVIFSVKVTQLDDSLDWPLDVYGMVAARDSIDRNRNLLFNRTRDNCQRLTSWDASLLLTGPSRAVVIVDPVNYEVELKVKGDTPSEDKLLSLLVIEDKYYLPGDRRQGVHCHTYSSKLSTVEVTVGHLAKTVEATIAVQVVERSWPTGQLAITVDLLHDGMVPVTNNGAIEFSRCVVSVEADGELTLGVDVWQGDGKAVKYQRIPLWKLANGSI
ncbi:hypothetical protein TRIUR3_08636 [Triticum urartu]|uniref:DUF6598 domain-containing protein n=1 Tax=Triticum urartu TaxID=4572 RepID=M7ZJK0_TRIUA|nr:hypothetical protein TRIUR3_08636 [Triticum urartu]